jgi:alpha 1,3-glucosidase
VFKTCSQSGFCKRHRDHKPESPEFTADVDTVKVENGHLSTVCQNTKNSVMFSLDLWLLKDNRFRFRFNELNPLHKRFEVQDVIIDDLEQEKLEIVKRDAGQIELKSAQDMRVILYANPLKVEFYIEDYLVTSFNSKNLLKFEHLRTKESEKVGEVAGEENPETHSEPDMWEETYKSHTDSKPNGPESIGLDITFNDFQHVYGIPQHADSFALRSTVGTDPYRLYNLDVFEYEVNNPMALYGSIPYMIAHNQNFSIGILWLNAAETWVDVSSNFADKSMFRKFAHFLTQSNEIPQMNTHWFSESGLIDIYIMLGPTPDDLYRQYGKLTGTTPLPALFSIAYHQCRWNYNDEDDVKNVNNGFEEHQLPMDVMWLDIEHTENKRYFTWDPVKFPHPEEMMENLSKYGRKLVTIVDPHIKIDAGYHIYTEAKELDLFVKDKTGNAIDGWCWPGSSSWPDFSEKRVQEWWADKFLIENYKGTTMDTYTWNDMNEPSMFNGPEVTFHKDAVHLNGFEHRNLHNQYGQYQHMSTFMGHLKRGDNKSRPFILTRSTFAGSQRYGAVWTGDNAAEWSHLKISIPMCLSFSVTGMSFCGADIGGFFKNPDAELMVRWYQAAAYQPFFRSHAHIDTKRREPWLFDENSLNLIRDALHSRYSLLYYWYTQFYINEKTGKPPMRPLWSEFPADTNTFDVDDQHMLGPSLMIKPITDPGVTSVTVIFPGQNEIWYDVKAMRSFEGGSVKTFTDINLASVPVFQRGGSIIPYKFRLRRASKQMANDPFTLLIALDNKESATGELYFDDSISYGYRNNKEFVHRVFKWSDNKLTSRSMDPESKFDTEAWLERVIIYGIQTEPKSIKIEYSNKQSAKLEFTFDPNGATLLIRKPGVKINIDFTIVLE